MNTSGSGSVFEFDGSPRRKVMSSPGRERALNGSPRRAVTTSSSSAVRVAFPSSPVQGGPRSENGVVYSDRFIPSRASSKLDNAFDVMEQVDPNYQNRRGGGYEGGGAGGSVGGAGVGRAALRARAASVRPVHDAPARAVRGCGGGGL